MITMDADLQDNPDEIPELYQMIANDGFDLVSGWKKKRFDGFTLEAFEHRYGNSSIKRDKNLSTFRDRCRFIAALSYRTYPAFVAAAFRIRR